MFDISNKWSSTGVYDLEKSLKVMIIFYQSLNKFKKNVLQCSEYFMCVAALQYWSVIYIHTKVSLRQSILINWGDVAHEIVMSRQSDFEWVQSYKWVNNHNEAY